MVLLRYNKCMHFGLLIDVIMLFLCCFRDKTTRSCKRKLELASLSLGSHDVTKAQDSGKKDPENPPPAKRWVIGPLFQSFKSKMASFTEIVMSPVRLFKSAEFPAGSNNNAPSMGQENKGDVGTDSRYDTFSKKYEISPVIKLPVVQRLNFDTSSSNVSDSEQNKVMDSQNGSEHQRDLIPEDDRCFDSLRSASTRSSTNEIPEGVRGSDVQQCSREEKQNCESLNPRPLVDHTDSVRTSHKKGSESPVKELIVLCERHSLDELVKYTKRANKTKSQAQPLPKNLRLPTPAVGKRMETRRLERKEVVEKEGTIGVDQMEDSPTLTQNMTLENLKLVQTGKRRKVQVSDEYLTTCNTGDFQMPSLNSSGREKICLKRASRSKNKRGKDGKCTLVGLDVMSATSDATKSASVDHISTNVTHDSPPAEGPPSSGSIMCARMTRQRKNNKVCKEERKPDVAESCCDDLAQRFRSSNRTSVRRSNIRQAKHKSETSTKTPAAKNPQVSKKSSVVKRVKRAVDAFEDQGMSMSLTLKVGSGVAGEKEANSIMTCGIMGKDAMLAEASCPPGGTPEDCLCVKDERVTAVDGGHLEKKDKPRTWCVYIEGIETQEEVEQEDDSKPGCGSNQLKRSLSCPDIASLQHGNDALINDETLCHPSPLKESARLNVNVPSPFKRTRRHTVCSVEIEREIAPLCLRKEVYPKWSTVFSHSYPQFPSQSLASIISCFLSSPLAFLSKKSSRGHGDDSRYGASSSSDLAVVSSSSSASPPSLNSPTFSSMMSRSAFFADAPRTPEQSSVSSHCR